MRHIFLLLQLFLSTVRRVLSPSHAVLPLIRILTAFKRFVRGWLKPVYFPSVQSTPTHDRQSHGATPQQHAQSTEALDCCLPSSVPAGPCGQQQDAKRDTLLLQQPVVPNTTLRSLPVPFVPEQFQRYQHRQPVEKKPNKEKVKACQITFLEEVPDEWERVVHPEGARYYFNAKQNVFTDISLTRLGDLNELHACIHFLREKESLLLSSAIFHKHPTQLVIQLLEFEQWIYYFVNHDAHVVFWVEDLDLADFIPPNILGVTEDTHIMYAIEAQYWWHCEQFPNSVSLLQDHVTEVWGEVAYAYIDSITSIAPLCPFTEDQLVKILGLMPYLQGRVCATDSHALWIIARAMRVMAKARFYHFYGQPGARLEGDMSVYSQQEYSTDKNHIFFNFLDFLLCFSLASHIEELNSIWIDDIINFSRWCKFSSNLITGWNGFTIYSTVMLAVDISLLGIPAANKGDVNSQSVAIIATYVSLLCITGSLISSILLARQISAINTSGDAVNFMKKMTCWKGGITILGIILSLPCALLIWAMFFFTLALLYVIFQTTDLASLTIMTLCTILLTSVISLPVWWGRNYGSLQRWLSILKGRSQQVITREQEPV